MTIKPARVHWDDLKTRLRASALSPDARDDGGAARREQVFADRARAFARRADVDGPSPRSFAVLVCRVGEHKVGIALCHVARVVAGLESTSLPGAASWLTGIASLDGRIRSVLDLGNLLSLAAEPVGGCVLLLRIADLCFGLSVDSVEDIRRVDPDRLAIPGGDADTPSARLIHGLTTDGMLVVRAEALAAHAAACGQARGDVDHDHSKATNLGEPPRRALPLTQE